MLACYDARTQRCLYSNSQYAKLGNLTPEQTVGRMFAEIIGADAAARIQPTVDRVLIEKTTLTYSRTMYDTKGEQRWIEVSLVPWQNPELERIFVLITDITRHRAAELSSKQSTDRLGRFMAASTEGIAFHVAGTITDVNPPLQRMLGYAAGEMIGHKTLEFVPKREHARVRQILATGAEITYESWAICKGGRELPVEYTVRNFEWTGKLQRLIVVRDISERRAAEERIRFLALHDVLTGLPNRAQLEDHLNQLIGRSHSNHSAFSLFFIDLDQLKRVNDSLGHSFGDVLLAAVAERLQDFCDSCTYMHGKPWLGRLGGDEFIIIVQHELMTQCQRFSEALQNTFQSAVDVNGRRIMVTASMGVASYPADGDTPSRLLKNADMAMYHAKASGRDTTRFFDESLALAADNALVIEEDLGHALQSNAFVLHYQPEVAADGKQVLTVEALVRWQHPTKGLLAPDAFIPIAEGLHLIVPIGQWVIDEALAQIPRWRQLGWKDAKVAVNLSSNQIRSPGFADNVLRSLQRLGLNGECLELELTERMLMGEDATVLATLLRLKQAGISMAIDDFGTGLSSLSRLRTLPIETLKIDKSFVLELPESASSAAIVKSILELARGLSLSAIAEGVETPAQRECLESMGCDAMQGFLFTQPLPADAFANWLKALVERGVVLIQA